MGERRRATEFSLEGKGQGQVRPEEKRDDPEGGEKRGRVGGREQHISENVLDCSLYKRNEMVSTKPLHKGTNEVV